MRTFTIGEVLNRLKEEFEDITISKIRFLESEGLIHPDRTDSGYRKFTEEDVDRLRYVLRSQRDRYLPLKVIKEELDRIDAGLPVEVPAPPLGPVTADDAPEPVASSPPATTTPRTPEVDDASSVIAPPTDVQLSLSELCDVTGLSIAQIRQLGDHGLIEGDQTFDGDDLQIARTAARLIDLGLEPRHLRMYLQFAVREIGVYEQLVVPLLKQRNPDSRARAQEQLDDLARHGSRLYRTMLGRRLRELLHPR